MSDSGPSAGRPGEAGWTQLAGEAGSTQVAGEAGWAQAADWAPVAPPAFERWRDVIDMTASAIRKIGGLANWRTGGLADWLFGDGTADYTIKLVILK